MKIELHNFGPIKFFEFDLEKDLTVVYGENNVGKSYAITAVYLILKNFRSAEMFIGTSMSFGDEELSIFKYIKQYKKPLIINEKVEPAILNFLEKFVEKLENSFINFFGSINSLERNMKDKKTKIIINNNGFEFSLIAFKNKLTLNNLVLPKIEIEIEDESCISVLVDNTQIDCFNFEELKHEMYLSIFENVNRITLNRFQYIFLIDCFFLPASKTGFYQGLNAFSPIIAELAKNKRSITQKIELPGLSEPVSDFIITMSEIDSSYTSNTFEEILSDLEHIIKGKIFFNEDSHSIGYIPDFSGQELKISASSTMITEISKLIAYLKYVMNKYIPRDLYFSHYLLFIEEPEAHLHPKVQIALMEIFARLSQMGVKIVMTSHSNYMFNKLSNLVLGGKIAPEKVASILLLDTPEGSEAKDWMKAEADGMDDHNFVDVAEQLYNERMELYDQLNKAHA